MTEVNPMRQRVLDYLSSVGLNGQNIVADDLNEHGFYAMNPVTGEASENRIAWPPGLSYQWLLALIEVASLEDMRLAGLRV